MVPNAKVIATDLDRKYAYPAVTDGTGRYAIRAIPPGQYTLAVEVPGFNRYVREKFAVDVNTAVTVDAVLQVATGTEAITVTDTGAALLETENAAIGQTVDRKFMNDLPLIGRGLADLVYLAPGVNPSAGSAYGPQSLSGGYDMTQKRETNFVSNGSRNAQSDVLVDSVSVTLPENNGGSTWAILTPAVDSIQEFKVQQGNFSAEFGQSGTSIVNAVTRSGTNAYHGTAYEFNRNKAFNANDFFSNANAMPLPPIRWNDFGGTAGGPIRKDKTFFFVNYDGWRSKNSANYSGASPTDLMKVGDFGELCGYNGGTFSASGRCSVPDGQIWDPFTSKVNPDGSWTHQNFIPFNNLKTYTSPGNPASPQGHLAPTPGNLIDPVSLKLAAYYPKPNMAPGAPGYDPLYFNWFATGVSNTANNTMAVKIDHQFNSNNLLAVKYSKGSGNNDNGSHTWGADNPADPNYSSQQTAHLLGVTVNYTSTLNAHTILTASAGDSRASMLSQTPLMSGKFKDLSPVTTLGMPAYIAASGWNSFPQVYVDQYQGIGSGAWANYSPGAETRHLMGSLTHIMGKHEVKAGAEFRMQFLNMAFNESPAGIYNISRWDTAQNQNGGGGGDTGGNGFASFMVGQNDGWGDYQVPIRPAMSAKKIGQYVQDNWRVTSNLTVNLGLRYDIELPRTERWSRQSYFDPSLPSPLTSVAGLNLHGDVAFTGVNGAPTRIHPTYWGQIQPRIGLAYRLGTNTSIRAGYGIYFDQSLTGLAGLGGYSTEGYSAYTQNDDYKWASVGVPGSFLRDPYPGGVHMPCAPNCGKGYLLGQTIRMPIRQWNRIPQEQSWSLGVQRQLRWGFLVDANYMGKKGTHLYLGGVNYLNYLPPNAAQWFRADPAAATAVVPNPLAGQPGQSDTIMRWRLWLPYPQYGSDFSPGVQGTSDPRGDSIFHSLQLRLEKRFSSGLQFLASWVWSKSIDDSSVDGEMTTLLGGAISVQNPFDMRGERALSQFNIPQVLQTAWVYELPFGRGKRFGAGINRFVDLALGGWQLNGTYRWDNGQPLAFGMDGGQALPTYGQRPNMLREVKKANGVNLNNYFACSQPDCSDSIAIPAVYAFGNASRTDPHLRAPGNNVISGSLFKSFALPFREGARAEIRAEFFNLLNHPVFSAPNSTFANPNFGKITSQRGQPRQGQLGLKLYF